MTEDIWEVILDEREVLNEKTEEHFLLIVLMEGILAIIEMTTTEKTTIVEVKEEEEDPLTDEHMKDLDLESTVGANHLVMERGPALAHVHHQSLEQSQVIR